MLRFFGKKLGCWAKKARAGWGSASRIAVGADCPEAAGTKGSAQAVRIDPSKECWRKAIPWRPFWFGRRRALAWTAAAVLVLAAVCGSGCQSEANRSLTGMEAWLARIQEFHHRHQKLPERLEDLQECFPSVEEFHQALRNPVTGDDPGYEYVKPPRGVLGTALADRVVMLYQLREGERAEGLPVGYVGGRAGLLKSGDITETVPRWQDFHPSEAPIQLAFPARPIRSQPEKEAERTPSWQAGEDKASSVEEKRSPLAPPPASKDTAVWSYRASFCGLEYMLFGMQNVLFSRVAQQDPYQLLNQLCEGLAKQHPVKIRSREKLLLQERPALDVELALPAYHHQLRVRWCLAGDRLYCLSVTGPEGSLNEENAGRFFQSFRFVPQ